MSSSNSITFFVDEEDVLDLLNHICEETSMTSYVPYFEKLNVLLSKYQEQPSLLNSSMMKMMGILTNKLLNHSEVFVTNIDKKSKIDTDSSLHIICQCIQLLCRVRGFKHVLKYFPHEVNHLELCVQVLYAQDAQDHDTWPTRYVYLLWLSVLNSIPFNILSLDSALITDLYQTNLSQENIIQNLSETATELIDIDTKTTTTNVNILSSQEFIIPTPVQSTASTLVRNIVTLSCHYLSDSGLTRLAAAHSIAALLSRPDMHHDFIQSYIDYSQSILLQKWLRTSSLSPTSILLEVNNDTIDNINEKNISSILSESKSVDENLNFEPSLIFQVIGILYSLSQILKKIDRANILSYAHQLLSLLLSIPTSAIQYHTIIRKLMTKLYGKIALIILPPKELTWRYSRGKRSLQENLSTTTTTSTNAITATSTDNDTIKHNSVVDISTTKVTSAHQLSNQENKVFQEIEYIEDTESIESILDVLFQHLQDSDTIVRWSAAKYIGRITMRLPEYYAEDIINTILQLFEYDMEDDATWHGGCLALAELARRNLIAPKYIPDYILPLLKQAMIFDIVKGYNSIGSHVRDAACYLCWSYGHSYEPSILASYIHELGCHILITAMFDREVNCRRAASAAFQENIGRQGAYSFPHGLEIMALADYHTLGNITSTYLNIAPNIIQYDITLYIAFQYHLRYHKLYHWDAQIRSLAAKSLAAMTRLYREKSLVLLYDLIQDCIRVDISQDARHGCLLACAEMIHALYLIYPPSVPSSSTTTTTTTTTTNTTNKTITTNSSNIVDTVHTPLVTHNELAYPSTEIIEMITNIVPTLQSLRLFRGKGSEKLRIASCYLIEHIAMCHLIISSKLQVILLEILNENLKQPHKLVQLAAKTALRQYLFYYFGTKLNIIPNDKLVQKTVKTYINGVLYDENVAFTRGYAQALGVLPYRLSTLSYTDSWNDVLCTIARVCQVTIKVKDKYVIDDLKDNNKNNINSTSTGTTIIESTSQVSSTTNTNTDVNMTATSTSSSNNTTSIVTDPNIINSKSNSTAFYTTRSTSTSTIAPTASTTSATTSATTMTTTDGKKLSIPLTPAAAAQLYLQKKKEVATAAATTATLLSTTIANNSTTTNVETNGDNTSMIKKLAVASSNDIETIVYLIEALGELIHKMEHLHTWNIEVIESIFIILLHACTNYTADNRGDVGSWVRLAALKNLEAFIYYLCRHIHISDDTSTDSQRLDSTDDSTITTYSTTEYYKIRSILSSLCKQQIDFDTDDGCNKNQAVAVYEKVMTAYGLAYTMKSTATATTSTTVTTTATAESDGSHKYPISVYYPYMSIGYQTLQFHTTHHDHSSSSTTTAPSTEPQQLQQKKNKDARSEDIQNDINSNYEDRNRNQENNITNEGDNIETLDNIEEDSSVEEETEDVPSDHKNTHKSTDKSMKIMNTIIYLEKLNQLNTIYTVFDSNNTTTITNSSMNSNTNTDTTIRQLTSTTGSSNTVLNTNVMNITKKLVLIQDQYDLIRKYITLSIQAILKQLGEKLDVVRSTAGAVITRLLCMNHPFLSCMIPEYKLLSFCLYHTICKHLLIPTQLPSDIKDNMEINALHHMNTQHFKLQDLDWSSPDVAYPFLISIYSRSSQYRTCIIEGMIISIGCMNHKIATMAKSSLLTLFHHIDSNSNTNNATDKVTTDISPIFTSTVTPYTLLYDTIMIIHKLYQNYTYNDRVILPLLKTTECILQQSILTTLIDLDNKNAGSQHDSKSLISVVYIFEFILTNIKNEMHITSNVTKIKLCLDIVLLYIQQKALFQTLQFLCMRILLVHLGHKYAPVRKYTAEILYLLFLSDPNMTIYRPTTTPTGCSNMNTSIDMNTISSTTIDDTTTTTIATKEITSILTTISAIKSIEEEAVGHVQENIQSFPLFPSLEIYDDIMSLLSVTEWEYDLYTSREQRKVICSYLHIELNSNNNNNSSIANHTINSKHYTKGTTSNNRASGMSALDDIESYSSLVREAGR